MSGGIAVHSLPELKNTTDDALPNYLNSLKFKQSHTLTDVRLGLSFAAVSISAVTFYLDYKYGFETMKTFTTVAVVIYFILNSALTYWIWGVERGKVYEGVAPNGTKLSLSSYTEKHSPIYHLRVSPQSPKSSKPENFEISAPFTTWFSADSHQVGQLIAKPLQQWLATEISVIGNVDAANLPKVQEEKVLEAEVKALKSGMDAGTPSQGTRNKIRRGR